MKGDWNEKSKVNAGKYITTPTHSHDCRRQKASSGSGGEEQPLTTQTDADRRDYFSPELQKFGVSGLPLPPALCSWEWDSPEPGQSPLSHISMRRKGGKRNKGNPHNQTQVCDLSAQSGSFCEKGLPRVMRVISQWLFYNGNNLIKHRDFHGVGAAINGGEWNGVCRTEIRCVLYQCCSWRGQQGKLLLRNLIMSRKLGSKNHLNQRWHSSILNNLQQWEVQGWGKRMPCPYN